MRSDMKFSCRILAIVAAFISGLNIVTLPWLGVVALVVAVGLFAAAEQEEIDG